MTKRTALIVVVLLVVGAIAYDHWRTTERAQRYAQCVQAIGMMRWLCERTIE